MKLCARRGGGALAAHCCAAPRRRIHTAPRGPPARGTVRPQHAAAAQHRSAALAIAAAAASLAAGSALTLCAPAAALDPTADAAIGGSVAKEEEAEEEEEDGKVAGDTETPGPPESDSEASPSGPFDYPELRRGVDGRKARERGLMQLRARVRQRVFVLQQRHARGELSEANFRLAMDALKAGVIDEAHGLVFGGEAERPKEAEGAEGAEGVDGGTSGCRPGDREAYLVRYGCVQWTRGAMRAVAALGPVVEMGAGNGQWARELHGAWGVDVVAYDNASSVHLLPGQPAESVPALSKREGEEAGAREGKKIKHTRRGDASGASDAIDASVPSVRNGDENALRRHRDRTLLLVCPPPGSDMASRCLAQHRGYHFVYVGEGRGGAHANAAFFDELELYWDVTDVVAVAPFPGCYERCFVMRRKKSDSWLQWIVGK